MNRKQFAPSPHTPPPRRIRDAYGYQNPALSYTTPVTRDFVPFRHHPTPVSYQPHQWRDERGLPTNQNLTDELLYFEEQRNPSERSSVSPTGVGRIEDRQRRPTYWDNQQLQGSTSTQYNMPSNPQQLLDSASTNESKESKRWSFGGLFRRKEKLKSPIAPVPIQFESLGDNRPTSPISPNDSSPDESEPPRQPNFLRRLSKKKRKASGDGSKAVTGLLVPPPSMLGRYHPHRRSTSDVQSWETTKKYPPSLLVNNNFSSSGSLSLSLEGSSSLSRGGGPRIAAKDAVKARAEARRESLLNSSSGDEEGEDESETNGQNGSNPSLTPHGVNSRRSKATNNSRVGLKSIPPPSLTQASFHRPTTNSSPNLHRGNYGIRLKSSDEPVLSIATPSRWEARIVYTGETVHEDKPVVVRLPRQVFQYDPNGNPPGNYMETTQDKQVITAGLRLPFNLSSSYPKTSEPAYANLRQFDPPIGSFTPPLPPRRQNFVRQQSENPEFYNYPNRPIPQSHTPQKFSGNVPLNYKQLKEFRFNGQNYRRENTDPIRQYSISPVNTTTGQDIDGLSRSYPLQTTFSPQHPIIMSKHGLPIRKLGESSTSVTVPPPSLQNANPAPRFWRKRDEAVRLGFTPSPNFFKQQPEPVPAARIRSADSSPIPLPKHEKNLVVGGKTNLGHFLHSNESISSLSSFSAESPSPNIFGSSKNNPTAYHNVSNPKSSSIDAKNSSQEESLTLKASNEMVRIKSSPSPFRQSPQNGKTSGKNLEDALNELEDMYKSLRLSDEDLLDRAERRDLPTPHQELREKDPLFLTSPLNVSTPIRSFRFSPAGSGSLESLATTSGSGSTEGSKRSNGRVRAPPMRRSGVPDLVNDDMAKRKYEAANDYPKANDPRDVLSQSGSYLMLSPVFSPPVSPCPGDQSYYPSRSDEPDIVTDDVGVRNIRRANSIRIIEEPQPLFGVPLGPITKAPATDYLHMTPSERFRPLFRHLKNPDLVKDDQAFRNLRKDLNQENNLGKDWTPRLFSPLRTPSSDSVFSYNIQPSDDSANGRKLRAFRSLSANISHLVNPPCTSSAIREDIGKWNSFTELNNSHSTVKSPSSRIPNYMEPSWIEQANLDEFGIVGNSQGFLSPNSNLHKKFKLVKPKPPPPRISPDLSVRRPWTDIILRSYERENEFDIGGASTSTVTNPELMMLSSPISEEDNADVFLDAQSTTPPPTATSSFFSSQPMANTAITPQIQPINNSDANLLPGQKIRRGSYIDPRPQVYDNLLEERKRRSWSEMPKQYDPTACSFDSITGSPKKLLFNPLPTPRRIKQVNLEGYRNIEEVSSPHVHSTSERELNDLIDALVKEADTCGHVPTVRRSESTEGEIKVEPGCVKVETQIPRESSLTQRKKRPIRVSVDKETKWRAAIAELESTPILSPTPSDSFKFNERSASPASALPIEVKSIDESNVAIMPSPLEESVPIAPPSTATCSFCEILSASAEDSIRRSREDLTKSTALSTLAEPDFQSHSQDEDPSSSHRPQAHLRGILKKRMEDLTVSPSTSKTSNSAFIKVNHQPSADCSITKCIPQLLNEIPTTNLSTPFQPIVAKFSIGKLIKRQNSGNILNAPTTSGEIKPEAISTHGMNGLRRLLNKEMTNPACEPEDLSSGFGRGLKKSPSAPSSYWSRISSNQPSFLRKLFEKVTPAPILSNTVKDLHSQKDKQRSLCHEETVEADSILPLSVAEKATHFMKLEHSQRFSKWRNYINNQAKSDVIKSVHVLSPPPKQPNGFNDSTPGISKMAKVDSTPRSLNGSNNDEQSLKSSNPEMDGKKMQEGMEPTVAENPARLEPSKLSLKDRVSMFNRLSSAPGINIQLNMTAAGNVSQRFNPPITVTGLQAHNLKSQMKSNQCLPARSLRTSDSTSSILSFCRKDIDSNYDNLKVFPLFRNHSTKDVPAVQRMPNKCVLTPPKSRHKYPLSHPIPVKLKYKNERTNHLSTSADSEYWSEDEVSSGGMEVAEIISRSYENSPITHKKNWKSALETNIEKLAEPKSGFLVQEMRKFYPDYSCESVDHKKLFKTTNNTNHGVSNFQTSVGFEVHGLPLSVENDKVLYPRQTTTSNLLPILAALSSSEELLN